MAKSSVMQESKRSLGHVPESRRPALRELVDTLERVGHDSVLGVCAFGGWLAEDPFFAGAARSVVVLRRLDVGLVERLAVEGPRLGELSLAAPLLMTPEYVRDSCDVFPLELLEIQQQHVLLAGQDYFAALTFDPRHVRLACEREFKSELIELRQGLLATAGRFTLLHQLCLDCLERSARIMRGLLHLDGEPAPQRLSRTIERVAERTGVTLGMHARLATVHDDLGLEGFRRFYSELEALAAHADALPH